MHVCMCVFLCAYMLSCLRSFYALLITFGSIQEFASCLDFLHLVCHIPRHFPIAGWSGMKSFIARNIWSFSSEEVGLLLHSMNTIGVKPSKNLCDAVSLRVEEGLNSFSFISRISSVQFLLNAGRRCNATVVALLRESHYVNGMCSYRCACFLLSFHWESWR